MKSLFAILIAVVTFIHMQDQNYVATPVSLTRKAESAEDKPLFTFGLISDVQYADCSHEGERYFRSSIEKLDKALSTFRGDSVDFIINLGDLIERDYESYKPVLNAINSSGIKAYHITGNHDYSVDPRYLSRLPVLNESRNGYYSIIDGSYRLIFLNGNEISTYASSDKTGIIQASNYIEKLKKNGEINAIDWNGGIGDKQCEWIISQLDAASSASEKVIFLCHFPVAPENIHNLLNYKKIHGIVSKYGNVVAWFNGHNHEGNYANFNKIHFVTFKGMVETKNLNSFAIIEVYNDKLVIKGSGREDSRVLSF
jgi:manganese-dependent ADP-ribose/CDP-alcohol diphosphatase